MVSACVLRLLCSLVLSAAMGGRLGAQVLSGISASDAAVDSQGFIYLAGSTSVANVPTTAGVFQPALSTPCAVATCAHGFVAKLAPSADTVVWATYLAGNGSESIRSLAMGADGNICVAGTTTSRTLPAAGSTSQFGPGQLFAAKLTTDGKSLLAVTYFGGSGPEGVAGIRFDAAGNVYIAGSTNSPDFPTTPGAYQRTLGAIPWDYPYLPDYCQGGDQFVTKFDPALKAVLFSTLIGTRFAESTSDFAVGPDNSVYVAGIRGDERNCASWGILTRLNPQGSGVIYATAGGQSLAVDPTGVAYVAHDNSVFGSAAPHADIWKVSPKGDVLATATIDGRVRSMAVGTGEIGVLGDSWPSRLNPTPGAPGACLLPYEPNAVPYLARLSPTTLAPTYLGYFRSNLGYWFNRMIGPDRVLASYPYYTQFPYAIMPIGLPPPGTVTCVLSAADYQGPGVSPGEILSVFGTEIGPASPALAQTDANGNISSELNGVRVTVNGLPAPLLYAASSQINLVMPFGVAGERVQFEIRRDAKPIAALSQWLHPHQPGLFATGTQFGPLAALNQAGSVNSATNPAAPGSVIAIFATGLGAMTPQLPDGAAPAQIANTPAVRPAITVNGQAVEVVYIGNAPTLVQGVAQINIRLPNPLPLNPYSLLYPGTARVGLGYPSEPNASDTAGNIWVR